MLRNAIRQYASTTLAAVIMAVAIGAATPAVHAGNPNPRIVPNHGHVYGELSEEWWQWAFSFPVASIPFFNQGGEVDIGAGQVGHVWFLAGANSGLPDGPRTGFIPTGTKLFFPIANLINDFPCPDPSFRPDPGETLEHFLQRTGNDALPQLTDLFAVIDGVALKGLSTYRVTSSLFMFSADPAAVSFDPCITGSSQFGVSVGYWILLNPLPPGQHTLRFGSPTWGQDVSYELTVVPGKRQ